MYSDLYLNHSEGFLSVRKPHLPALTELLIGPSGPIETSWLPEFFFLTLMQNLYESLSLLGIKECIIRLVV